MDAILGALQVIPGGFDAGAAQILPVLHAVWPSVQDLAVGPRCLVKFLSLPDVDLCSLLDGIWSK